MGEFVHYATDFFPGATSPAIVVGVPRSEPGKVTVRATWIERVATIKRWEKLGHLATVRDVLRAYRAGKAPTVPIGGGKWGEGALHYLRASVPAIPATVRVAPRVFQVFRQGGGGRACAT